ncbi:MAG: hypothetical protein H6834_14135 [Planctomycetes bacterium]|nr:hypothetical protein [Planctomycetota bacterium]
MGVQKQRGSSFVEVSVSLALSVPIVLGAGVLFHEAMSSMSSTADKAKVGTSMQHGFDRLRADLSLSNTDHVEIVEEHPHYDMLRVQVPLEITPSGVTWGVELTQWKDGAISGLGLELEAGARTVSMPNWWIRYRVEGRDLLREIVDEQDVVHGRPELIVSGLARRKDLRGSGKRCFHAWRREPTKQPRLLSVAVLTSSTREGENANRPSEFVKEMKATVRVGAQ